MKYILITLTIISHFEASSQNNSIPEFKSVNISKTNDEIIYVFDGASTTKTIKLNKKNKFLNYYQLNECDYLEIDSFIIDKMVSEKKVSKEKIKHFVRQYFPYINKKGEIILRIALLKREENLPNQNYSNWPISCYDCEGSFFIFYLNMSLNKFFTLE
jgi:hypothetical protein